MKAFTLLVAFLCLSSVVLGQNYCGPNCPSGNCVSCPCGSSSDVVAQYEVQGYLSSAGLNVDVFICIAQAESSFNANAMNQNGNNMVVGLFQENDDNGYSASQLCDPQTATTAAAALYQECGICPWIDDSSCFNTACCNGSYCNNGCTV